MLSRLARREQQRRGEVDEDPDQRDDEHDPALDLRRIDQTADRAVQDPYPDDQQRQPVDLRGQDLHPLVSERPAAARGTGRHGRREDGETERGGVGEHVPRVGEQCERVRDQAEDDLAGHEQHDQDERAGQGAPVAVFRRRMRMRMFVNHLLVSSVLV